MLGLGTLIKYEMKAVGRRVLPFFGGLLAITIIFGDAVFMLRSGGAVVDIFSGVFGALYGVMIAAVIINTAIVLIQRYYSNLMGKEGYLHFTLPVTTNAHIANKTISAGIWITLSFLVTALSVLIILLFAVTPGELAEEIRSIMMEITDFDGGIKVILIIIEALVLAFVGFGEAAIKAYAAISVGHLWTDHRVLGAVGAYIGFAVLELIAAGIMDRTVPISTLWETDFSGFTVVQLEFLVTLVVALILMAIYWVVCNRIIEKRLNLH